MADLEAENASTREEASKLSMEKAALLSTVKRLNKDITRLDAFKRNLLQTLQDDEDPEGGAEPALLALGAAGAPIIWLTCPAPPPPPLMRERLGAPPRGAGGGSLVAPRAFVR